MCGSVQRVCVCVGYVEAEGLTMSCPPTVQPSAQEGVSLKYRDSHTLSGVQKHGAAVWVAGKEHKSSLA